MPLQSYALKGGSKNHYTNATLQILPRRADDGAKYKCVVRNRAMPEGHSLETSVALNVNCEYKTGGQKGWSRKGSGSEVKLHLKAEYGMEPKTEKETSKKRRKTLAAEFMT